MQQDADDLTEFLAAVVEISHARGSHEVQIVLMGHSTGCQDIVMLMGRSEMKNYKISGLILQGAVSDREAFDAAVEANPRLKDLREEIATIAMHMQPDEFLPRRASLLVGREGDPITAGRFMSLNGKQTVDDIFSSDLTVEYFKKRLGHIVCPVLLLLSGADEYYPSGVSAGVAGEKIASGFGAEVRMEVVEKANHFLFGHELGLCEIVTDFLKTV